MAVGGSKRRVASEAHSSGWISNTEFAEDTEKKEKSTGLKTGHYKARRTNGDAVQNKYTDV